MNFYSESDSVTWRGEKGRRNRDKKLKSVFLKQGLPACPWDCVLREENVPQSDSPQSRLSSVWTVCWYSVWNCSKPAAGSTFAGCMRNQEKMEYTGTRADLAWVVINMVRNKGPQVSSSLTEDFSIRDYLSNRQQCVCIDGMNSNRSQIPIFRWIGFP